MMDMKDFNTIGLSMDDMIDAYIQSVLSVIAIDQLCCRLHKEDVCFYLTLIFFIFFLEYNLYRMHCVKIHKPEH